MSEGVGDGRSCSRGLCEENVVIVEGNVLIMELRTGRGEAVSKAERGPSARAASASMTAAKCWDLLQ